MNARSLTFLMMLFLMGALYGCAPGKGPFLLVQICLGDERNLLEFTKMMRAVAQSYQMKFADASVRIKRELQAIHALRQADPIIYMGVERNDGLAVVAGNVGLPGYQVALRFSEGSDASETTAFADSVVRSLERRWHVERVPASRGALPMNACGNGK
jgi:hypothetical protein